MHGWKLSYASELGHGTVATVTMPGIGLIAGGKETAAELEPVSGRAA